MRFLLLTVLLFFPFHPAMADDPFAAVHGIWLTEDGDGAVALERCGDSLCGKFHWLKRQEGEPLDLDDRNPDPALRQRPLCGMTFIENFKPETDGRFTGGWIYSPRHGAKFSATIKPLDANRLELRGYLLLPILGESQIWRRAQNLDACTTS